MPCYVYYCYADVYFIIDVAISPLLQDTLRDMRQDSAADALRPAITIFSIAAASPLRCFMLCYDVACRAYYAACRLRF